MNNTKCGETNSDKFTDQFSETKSYICGWEADKTVRGTRGLEATQCNVMQQDNSGQLYLNVETEWSKTLFQSETDNFLMRCASRKNISKSATQTIVSKDTHVIRHAPDDCIFDRQKSIIASNGYSCHHHGCLHIFKLKFICQLFAL